MRIRKEKRIDSYTLDNLTALEFQLNSVYLPLNNFIYYKLIDENTRVLRDLIYLRKSFWLIDQLRCYTAFHCYIENILKEDAFLIFKILKYRYPLFHIILDFR